MEALLTFAQTASPLAILALVVVVLAYVVFKTYKGENLISKISDTQDEKYPLLMEHIQRFNNLDAKLEKIASNHLHDLPAMAKSIANIEHSMEKVVDKQISQGEDIAALKALNKK
jgi:hypothetical protein